MIRALPLIALALLACGDAIVDGTFRGESLFTLQGRVEVEFAASRACTEAADACWRDCPAEPIGDEDPCDCEEGFEACVRRGTTPAVRPWEEAPEQLRLAVFWSRDGLEAPLGAAPGLIEQGGRTVGRFPGLFDLHLFRPPPATVMRRATGHGAYALAAIALYLDADGDGRFRADRDRLVGGARNQAIVFSPSGFEDQRLGRRPAGWARIDLQIDCDNDTQTVTATAEGPLRLGLTTAESSLEEVLIDYDCDGAFEDACDEDFVDFCAEENADDPECLLCLAPQREGPDDDEPFDD